MEASISVKNLLLNVFKHIMLQIPMDSCSKTNQPWQFTFDVIMLGEKQIIKPLDIDCTNSNKPFAIMFHKLHIVVLFYRATGYQKSDYNNNRYTLISQTTQ